MIISTDRSKKLVIALSFICLSSTACQQDYITYESIKVLFEGTPLETAFLGKKRSLDLSITGSSTGLNAQGAVALYRGLFMTGGYSTVGKYELGIGHASGDSDGSQSELLVGIGAGSASGRGYAYHYTVPYLQGGVGTAANGSELGFAMRLSYLNAYQIDKTFVIPQPDSTLHDGFERSRDHLWILEPTLIARAGWRHFQFSGNIGFPIKLSNGRIELPTTNASLGLTCRF